MLGLSYGASGDPLQAKKYFLRSLTQDPENFFINYNLAKALSESNLDEESLIYHKKTIEIDSKNTDGWLNYGISLKKLKKYDSAINCFNKGILA